MRHLARSTLAAFLHSAFNSLLTETLRHLLMSQRHPQSNVPSFASDGHSSSGESIWLTLSNVTAVADFVSLPLSLNQKPLRES